MMGERRRQGKLGCFLVQWKMPSHEDVIAVPCIGCIGFRAVDDARCWQLPAKLKLLGAGRWGIVTTTGARYAAVMKLLGRGDWTAGTVRSCMVSKVR